METLDDHFEVYHIDLDDMDPVLQGPILRYPFKRVNEEKITAFHCRGGSQKEKINLNRALMIYIMHGESLYAWTGPGTKLQKIDTDCHNLYYMSDDVVFYMRTKTVSLDNKHIEHSRIFKIESKFGSYQKSEIYMDQDNRAEILNFGVDNTRKILIVLTGIKNMKDKRDKYVTLYDTEEEKVIY